MQFQFGDVVYADLDPSSGHEQNKRRPLIVVSNDSFNTHCSLNMVIPITHTDNGYALHYSIGEVPPENLNTGKSIDGFAEIEQLKSLDLNSRNAVVVGRIDQYAMEPILSLVISCLITPDMSIYSSSY